jgi:hypothetical protein
MELRCMVKYFSKRVYAQATYRHMAKVGSSLRCVASEVELERTKGGDPTALELLGERFSDDIVWLAPEDRYGG